MRVTSTFRRGCSLLSGRGALALLVCLAWACAGQPADGDNADTSAVDDTSADIGANPDTAATKSDTAAVDASGGLIDSGSTSGGQDAGGSTDAGAPLDTGAAQDTSAAPDSGSADGGQTTDSGATPDTGAADTKPSDGSCKTSADCAQPKGGCDANVCLGGTCTPQALADGTPCDDDDPCTATSACKAAKCAAGIAVQCDDGNPCTTGACEKKTGKCASSPVAAKTQCDDGDPCTQGTACDDKGACGGGVNNCGCSSAKDCAAFDDGDPCNGVLFCNTALPKPTCQVVPASVVICDDTSDGPCATTQCDPTTGQCAATPKPAGAPCDDGNPCTTGDACSNGQCSAAANTCQCQQSVDCLKHEDGNACNGTLYCDTSALPFKCAINPSSVPTCSAPANPCQVAACDAKTGACAITNAKDGAHCDDGDPKTVGDSCQAGTCAAGTSIAQCKDDGDCAKHEDGDLCNGTLFCNKATGGCQVNPNTIVQCPSVDDSACTKNQCAPKTGVCALQPVKDGASCDDDNPCTVGEVCAQGGCKPSAFVCQCKEDADCASKDDGDLCNGTLFCNQKTNSCELNKASIVTCPHAQDTACSVNTCDKKTGKCGFQQVVHGKGCDDDDPCTAGETCKGGACEGTKICACSKDADCASQDDGDLCNGTMFCNGKLGKCAVNPATIKVCATVDDTACAQNKCQPKTGKCAMQPVFNGAACDADGNPCTANDHCDGGTCKAGKSTCGCYVDKDCEGKQADNKCVQSMFCDKKTFTCQPAKKVQCDTSKDNACLVTRCDPDTGECAAKAQPNGTICGESAVCAGAQLCLDGKCAAGKASDCDDADACTADSCDPKSGCAYTAKDSGDCDDGNVCTSADGCSKGQCVGTAKDCSDESPCTDDACDPKEGCVHLPSKATSCDDGDLCREGDFCLQGLCIGGSKLLLCDDGNPCTTDGCDPKQGCVTKAATGVKCDDGDACTKADVCAAGTCKGTELSCDDGSGCTKDACDADQGCVHLSLAGTPCDDGNACTVGDTCIKSGLCASGQPRICDDANPCTVDLCDPLQGCVTKAVVGSKCDDGNACTVNEKCEKAQCTGSPRDYDDGLPCSKDTCDADAGCQHAVTAGSKCDDGNACTAGDICAKTGACVPGAGLDCNDNQSCTTDNCSPKTGCTHKALDGVGCDDGDSCTQADKCVQGKCKGSGKSCDDGLVCTKDGCDPAGGCVNTANTGQKCSDDNACTNGDACLSSGFCRPGKPVVCDDSNACTDDVCLPQKGCAHTPKNGASCDDGDACTSGDTCNSSAQCGGSPTSCDDGKSCTKDSCDKAKGCLHVGLQGASCNDGNVCTVGDVCLSNGACAPGSAKVCNDNNTCTLDTCDALKGCVFTVTDKAGCDDGSKCTSGDACKGASCVGSPVSCDDGKSCTKDSCDKVKGCLHAPLAGTACNDGNACTVGDKCSSAGTCAPGAGRNCDDGKPCTSDGCDAANGCVHSNLSGIGCTDGNACTGPDLCDKGACKGSPVSCDDGQSCTKDSCDLKQGCRNEPLAGTGCSDGNACTGGDKCNSQGKCAPGPGINCDDSKPCTTDACNVSTGCVHTSLSGIGCSDGNACTGPDLCDKGACTGSPVSCDDGSACTTDSCDTKIGCKNVAKTGQACSDNNACTSGDKCTAKGTCGSGAPVSCDDKNPCTADSCDTSSGCKTTALTGKECSDGDYCTSLDTCTSGTCGGTTVNCDDNNACTTDSCDKAKGCKNLAKTGVTCDDGDACSTSDKCDSGGRCSGSKKVCDDSNKCTLDSCDKVTGCVFTKLEGAACDDGKKCTVKDSCSDGVCGGTALSCEDKNECTNDSCSETAGCVNAIQQNQACNDGSECTVSDACSKAGKCAGLKKNCSDGNDCTDDSCHTLLGCLYKNAATDAACDDGDTCTNNWCDGSGSCQAKARLWSHTLLNKYVPYDMQINSAGDAVVVGQSASISSGAFFLRVANGGKQPGIVPATGIHRWRKVRSRPGGGYMAIGDTLPQDSTAEYTISSLTWLARLDADGKVVKYDQRGFNKAQPNYWLDLAVGQTWAVAASTRRWQGAADNGFFFTHRNMGTDVSPYAAKMWKPSGLDRWSVLQVNGVTVLTGGTMLALVTYSTNSGTFTADVRVSPSGSISATTVWSAPYPTSTSSHSGYFRIVEDPLGGFDVHVGANGRKRRRYTALGKLFSVHEAPGTFGSANPWGNLRDVVIRGTQVVGINNNKRLAVMNRSEKTYHSYRELPEAPSMVRVGPDRNLYLVFAPAAAPAPQQWRIEQADPWGNTLCTDCLVKWGKKGCQKGPELLDSCNIGTGNCANVTATVFCDDGNPCTTDQLIAYKECKHTPKTGQSCSVADTHCSLSTSGTCSSSGQCSANPSRKFCITFSSCYQRTCDDYDDNVTTACQSIKRHTGHVCGSGKSCSNGSCYTDSGVISGTYNGEFTLTSKNQEKVLVSRGVSGKRLRSAKVRFKVYTALFKYSLILRTPAGDKTLLWSGTSPCGPTYYNQCVPQPKDVDFLEFPTTNKPVNWIDGMEGTYAFAQPWQLIIKRTQDACSGICLGQPKLKAWAQLLIDDY